MGNVFGSYKGQVNYATWAAKQWLQSDADILSQWRTTAAEIRQRAGDDVKAVSELAEQLQDAVKCAVSEISYNAIAADLITGRGWTDLEQDR